MSSGSSNKPIVFVFGAKKGDTDARKRNLSAINTQVAYCAHERRREKNLKSRQRAQTKEEEKVHHPVPPSVGSVSPTSSIKAESVTNFNQFSSRKPSHQSNLDSLESSPTGTSLTSFTSAASATTTPTTAHGRPPAGTSRPRDFLQFRRQSDLVSNVSSDRDITNNDVWSTSPVSAQQSTPTTELSSLSPLAPVSINGYFDSALDPFFKLPAVASDREKWLVHFYFREMGHVGFGTRSNALFCPDRDWVSQYVSSKTLCFQWILILAEEHLGRLGVLDDQTNTIQRKAKAYGSMNTLLKSGIANRDEGISGIMYAAIVDTARTSMHLMALDRYINDTGGFEAFLDGPLGIAHPEHIATVYAFGPCPVPNLADLETIKNRFLNILRQLYQTARLEQEEKRRIRNRQPWNTAGHQVLDANSTLVSANRDEHFRYYIKVQQDCLSSTCIAQLLNTTLVIDSDYMSQARHFATLVQTLLILNEFDDLYVARAMFLKRLRYVVEMSSATDPATLQPLLTRGGLLLINSYVRQEVQDYFDRTKTLAKGVSISKTLVDFLKIFPLLSQSARSLIVGWLRNWLCHNDQIEDVEVSNLHEADLYALSALITKNWYTGNKSGS